MRDKMAISAYILKIVEKDPFLRLQMRAKEEVRKISKRAMIAINLRLQMVRARLCCVTIRVIGATTRTRIASLLTNLLGIKKLEHSELKYETGQN